jgi:hypothetical protein
MTVDKITIALKGNQPDNTLQFEEARDKDAYSILKELYLKIRDKSDLSFIEEDDALKDSDVYDEFEKVVNEWLAQAKLSRYDSIAERLLESEKEIMEDFASFTERMKHFDVNGHRALWARNLGLENLLCETIQPGNILDQLKGFRDMSDDQLMNVCHSFFEHFCVKIFREQLEQRQLHERNAAIDKVVYDPASVNAKFMMPGKELVFADLDDFYRGAEARIGIPNVDLWEGMYREHCCRSTKRKAFITNNYGLFTTSELEWYWITDSAKCDPVEFGDLLTPSKDAPSTLLFPGEVGQEIVENLIQITCTELRRDLKLAEKDVIQSYQEGIIRQLQAVFTFGSKIFEVPDRICRLRDVRILKNFEDRDSKLEVCLAISFVKELELNEKMMKDALGLLRHSNIIDLLAGVQISMESDAEEARTYSLELKFPKKAEAFKQLQNHLGEDCASKFIEETVQIKLFTLLSRCPTVISGTSEGKQAFSIPTRLNEKKIQMVKTNGDSRLELKVTDGPTATHDDVFLHYSITYDRSIPTQHLESTRSNIEAEWSKEFRVMNNVRIDEMRVIGKETILYCEDPNAQAPNPSLNQEVALPDLSVTGVRENSLDSLCNRLKEQEQNISQLLQILRRQRERKKRKQGRIRKPKIEEFLLELSNTLNDDENISLRCLVLEEVAALRLYTGPLYVVYNALLRSFPLHLAALFNTNRFESTIFAIISGIHKLSRHTKVPKNRTVYRGLSGMLPPQDFWIDSRKAGYLGGVEFGLQSTTEDENIALEYSGIKEKRAVIFEIQVGKIDIGASISFVSQYPNEKEFLMQPLSCLEVD